MQGQCRHLSASCYLTLLYEFSSLPFSKTEQYKNSFFVRTVADWNKLEDTVVTADSVTAFSSAVGRVLQGAASHIQAVSTKMCFSQFLNRVK